MASEQKHTPGPWGYDAEFGLIYYADSDLQPGIAEISQDNTLDEQANADGHLIAAAPDMLAALQFVRDHILTGFDTVAMVAKLDTAIAKATQS